MAERLLGERALKSAKRHSRRPADLIDAIFDGTVDKRALKRPLFHSIQEVANRLPDPNRDAFRRLLLLADSKGDLLGLKPALSNLRPIPGNIFVEGLGEVARRSDRWIAEPETWRPAVHNSRR